MVSETPGRHPVDHAWRRFDAGDLAGAISSARELAGNHANPAPAIAAWGFFLLQAGEIGQAAEVLLPALGRFPGYAPLHWYVGYLYQRRGESADAAAALQRACELDGSLDEAAYALAWSLHDLGRIEEAATWSIRAVSRSRTPQRLLQLGWMCQRLQLFAQAANAYREAMASLDGKAPEQVRLRLHLSQCLRRLGRHDEADGVLREGLDRSPGDPELLAETAWRQHSLGDPHGALRVAQALVRDHPERAAAWHLLGVLRQQAGDLDAADEAFTAAQERDLTLTDALLRRALIRREKKQFAGARELLGLILSQFPGDEAAQDLLAQVLLDLDRIADARRLLVRSLRNRPRAADLWRLLAVTHARRARPQVAARALRRALALEPGNVEALRTRGWWSLEQGDTESALDAVRALLARLPHDSAAQVQAAFVLTRAGQLDWAQLWAERAVANAPGLADAWRALSVVRLAQRRLAEADGAAREALALAPRDPDCLRQRGWVLLASARHGEAQRAFRRALENKPGDPVVRLELLEVRRRSGHFASELPEVESLLEERPGWRPALLQKAVLLTEGGLDGAAQACARLLDNDVLAGDGLRIALRLTGLSGAPAPQLLAAVPLDAVRDALHAAIAEAIPAHGQEYLFGLLRAANGHVHEDMWIDTVSLYAASLSAVSDAPGLARQARDWYRSLKVRSGLAGLPIARRRAPADGVLRIAYVAGQLHQSLLRRVLAAHGDEVQVYLFTNQAYAGLPAHVHIHPLVPGDLAESCAANRVDVVIDAGGLHPFEGQFELLRAYVRRVAPVQLGWLGCWGSTGGLFDAILSDAVAVPADAERHYEESVFRLEGGQWCWDPPVDAPDPGDSPALRHGGVTYGVTARSLKLGSACFDAFARVVAATPDSSIRFIGEIAGDWPLRREVEARMLAQGVAAGRVFFDPFLPPAQYLAWFSRVDIVLDSFPGNGGLSLLDPLWMGVPVVTLAGDWAGARQGACVLSALGLHAWVADSDQRFGELAVALACDVEALGRHRAQLRSLIAASPLVDGRRVAAQVETICARLKAASAGQGLATDAKARTRAHASWTLDEWLSAPRVIELPVPDAGTTPDLSVVIVLFNQAGLSRRTLQALADQRDVLFETIVVDNASSDRTGELLARTMGARIIRSETNQGFLLAARQGAAQAKGHFIAFLNSDAILQDGALKAAVAAMRADASIGALGGRIVLTDGGLQEAGSVVFRDGLALGIGRGEDAFGHAARAARATDYVSGVFLVTPAHLWRRLGGFDEGFAPAYYEDTDYCVRVWKAGLRVVYEPGVLIEHLEWGSAAGDSATVLMERNRARFLQLHGEWLQHQPWPQVLPLEADRWRSPLDRPTRRPRVLVLDNEVPHMARGGGLPRARLMLQALGDWPVTLFPLWTRWDDWPAVYASVPPTVEVAMGHGFGGLEAFLERRRGVYDVLLVSRPPNLRALLPLRRRRPELFMGMRLVYDAEALFALREVGMAAVRGQPLGLAAARKRIEAEVALADGASEVLVVSHWDARHFERRGHRTRLLSHSAPVRREAPGVDGRSGMLFVGALHPGTPNEDGLVWFIREVMPRLRSPLRGASDSALTIVGICRSAAVAALEGPDVRILGPQEALAPHYDFARVFVAPARFAGGVPAKVIEAAAAGVPVVASSLLVRQLGWRAGIDIRPAANAENFAAAVAALMEDDAAWERQRAAAWQQCALRYEPEAFARELRQVIAGLPTA